MQDSFLRGKAKSVITKLYMGLSGNFCNRNLVYQNQTYPSQTANVQTYPCFIWLNSCLSYK